jgi:hypothetical protein
VTIAPQAPASAARATKALPSKLAPLSATKKSPAAICRVSVEKVEASPSAPIENASGYFRYPAKPHLFSPSWPLSALSPNGADFFRIIKGIADTPRTSW